MPSDHNLIAEIGLDRFPPLHRDLQFWIAILAGPVFWILLGLFVPLLPMPLRQLLSTPFLFLTFWQPTIEELLFRGFLQSRWSHFRWGRRAYIGITASNLLTSILFAIGHLFLHPPEWALAVFIPSLVFGYFRDRHASVYPSIFLHIFYNGGYFFISGLP